MNDVDVLPASQMFPTLAGWSIVFRGLAALNALGGVLFGGFVAFADGGLFRNFGILGGSVFIVAGLFASAVCLFLAEMIRLALSVEQNIRATAVSSNFPSGDEA